MNKRNETTEMMFKLMDYDHLSDAQHDLIISFESQFVRTGSLSYRQFEVLSNIFQQANEA